MLLKKIVIVGDGSVGKTALLTRYVKNEFLTEHNQTVFEYYQKNIQINNENYSMSLFDTAGQENFEHIRKLAYPNTDVFLAAFDISNPQSFENVKNLWVPDIKNFSKKIPFLLVGTKVDLRDDSKFVYELSRHKLKPITQEQGKTLAQQLGAVKYVECSSLTKAGIDKVFMEALIAAIDFDMQNVQDKSMKDCCSIL